MFRVGFLLCQNLHIYTRMIPTRVAETNTMDTALLLAELALALGALVSITRALVMQVQRNG